jgi:uncharacterized protein DUF4115
MRMTRPKVSDVAFSLLIALAVFLAVFGVLVSQGKFVNDDSKSQKAPPLPVEEPPPPTAVKTTPAGAAVAYRITIVAARGSCWVSAHIRSATGPVLAERVLSQGETLRLRGRRIWLVLGAAGNVDVTVNGRSRRIPSGTTTLVLK